MLYSDGNAMQEGASVTGGCGVAFGTLLPCPYDKAVNMHPTVARIGCQVAERGLLN